MCDRIGQDAEECDDAVVDEKMSISIQPVHWEWVVRWLWTVQTVLVIALYARKVLCKLLTVREAQAQAK